MRRAPPGLPALLAATLVAGALLPACRFRGFGGTTQRWPPPMDDSADPLPPGDLALHPPGPEDVTVLRHSDPVRVRNAGSAGSQPMAFYDKLMRLRSGSALLVGAGGRAEILWPTGSSVVLYSNCIAWIGSSSRGEPLLDLEQVWLAVVHFVEPQQVRLPGGALVSGESGPFRLERRRDDVLSVRNDSVEALQIAYRDVRVEIVPGQAVDVPILSAGSVPFDPPAGVKRYPGPGFEVEVVGQVDVRFEERAVVFRATGGELGERELRALGVRVRLLEGEEVRFSGLGPQVAGEVPAPAPLPAPQPPSTTTPAPVVATPQGR